MRLPPDEFLGLTANGWIAVGTVALALATFLLVAVAWYQLVAIRDENKRSRTLAVCERYDTDPVLDICLRNLSQGWRTRDIHYNPRKYRIDAATLLNYIESVFNGVDEGVYDEYLVFSFFEETTNLHITDYLTSDLREKMDIGPDEFSHIIKMCEKWKNNPPKKRIGLCARLRSKLPSPFKKAKGSMPSPTGV
ncbi:MAG: hypothetical protein RO009_14250 [Pseudorhodoplanes sp.]|nr:hypothetical protein [Pseudorhodoplanes sp.]